MVLHNTLLLHCEFGYSLIVLQVQQYYSLLSHYWTGTQTAFSLVQDALFEIEVELRTKSSKLYLILKKHGSIQHNNYNCSINQK